METPTAHLLLQVKAIAQGVGALHAAYHASAHLYGARLVRCAHEALSVLQACSAPRPGDVAFVEQLVQVRGCTHVRVCVCVCESWNTCCES